MQSKQLIILIGRPRSGKTYWRANNTEFPCAEYVHYELGAYTPLAHTYNTHIDSPERQAAITEHNKLQEHLLYLLSKDTNKGLVIDGVWDADTAHDIIAMVDGPFTAFCFEPLVTSAEQPNYNIIHRFDCLYDICIWLETQPNLTHCDPKITYV
jgi:hypothetical protein